MHRHGGALVTTKARTTPLAVQACAGCDCARATQTAVLRAATLVRGSAAFYNPRNTRVSAVVSFTRVHGTQPPEKSAVLFARECLKIELILKLPDFLRSTE
jgi:hypothetical protein